MPKPYIISTRQERKDRIDLYENYCAACLESNQIESETIKYLLRPPQTKMEAMLELFLWQNRKKS